MVLTDSDSRPLRLTARARSPSVSSPVLPPVSTQRRSGNTLMSCMKIEVNVREFMPSSQLVEEQNETRDPATADLRSDVPCSLFVDIIKRAYTDVWPEIMEVLFGLLGEAVIY